MATKNDPELTITPKSGDKKTIFDIRGSGFKSEKVLDIDFGNGAKSSVTVSEDGYWHMSFRYAVEGNYDLAVQYVGDKEVLETATIKVSD